MHWAVELESFNPKMLWNRLRIIASEDIGMANSLVCVVIDVLARQYFEALEKKKDSKRLFLSHAILLLARSTKSRIVDNFLLTVYGDIEKGIRLEIPDYALDNHTARGKSKGRGVEFFIKEGTKLVNETMADPYKERAEKILKK